MVNGPQKRLSSLPSGSYGFSRSRRRRPQPINPLQVLPLFSPLLTRNHNGTGGGCTDNVGSGLAGRLSAEGRPAAVKGWLRGRRDRRQGDREPVGGAYLLAGRVARAGGAGKWRRHAQHRPRSRQLDLTRADPGKLVEGSVRLRSPSTTALLGTKLVSSAAVVGCQRQPPPRRALGWGGRAPGCPTSGERRPRAVDASPRRCVRGPWTRSRRRGASELATGRSGRAQLPKSSRGLGLREVEHDIHARFPKPAGADRVWEVEHAFDALLTRNALLTRECVPPVPRMRPSRPANGRLLTPPE